MSSTKNVKIWKATKHAAAGVMVDQKNAYLIGNSKNFVAASNAGVSIMGKSVTIGTTSENIRKGGLFVEMNDLVKMVPTTLVTPMPAQVPFPPLAMVSSIMKDLPFFLAMVGGAAIAGAVVANNT